MIADLRVATLMVDVFTSAASSASASINLSRCCLAAASAAAIDPLIRRVGVGWAFTICGAILIIACGFAWSEWQYGRKWREAREAKVIRERGAA